MEKKNALHQAIPDDSASPRNTAAPLNPAPLPEVLPPQEWQQSSQPVFVVEDSFYRSRTPPRPVHWSIAWSDLMMTMFILFLTLFAHLRTHQEILAHGKPNKVADETVPVQAKEAQSSLIFHPISQDVTLKTGEKQHQALEPLKELKGADIRIRHAPVEEKRGSEPVVPIPELPREPKPTAEPQPQPQPQAQVQPQAQATPQPQAQPQPTTANAPPPREPEPQPPAQEAAKQEEALNTRIYDLSKTTVAKEKLEQFASVELVPDKTVRIILTGDLLFASGQAELTPEAVKSLKKIVGIMEKTPYMINVVGHTDDRPVRSTRFPSNWELSLARAGRVARFLIDETKLPASQFSVSGFSSFRPVKPNTSEENRKANRRVEIVLSKELPKVEAPSPDNLQ